MLTSTAASMKSERRKQQLNSSQVLRRCAMRSLCGFNLTVTTQSAWWTQILHPLNESGLVSSPRGQLLGPHSSINSVNVHRFCCGSLVLAICGYWLCGQLRWWVLEQLRHMAKQWLGIGQLIS
jgi:hypothetical protein